MFIFDTTVRLHHTDAAGVLFFGNYFKIVHDAYEQFMISIGLDFRTMLDRREYLILIVHADGDFLRPMYTGDQIHITIRAAKIGRTSFTLAYELEDEEGRSTAKLTTAHVAVDCQTNRPIALPEMLKAALQGIT